MVDLSPSTCQLLILGIWRKWTCRQQYPATWHCRR